MDIKFILIIFAASLIFNVTDVAAYPTAKITALVVDDNKVPVSNANVSISFVKPKTNEWGLDTYNIKGKSDINGLFSASGEGIESVGVFVMKDEYYSSGDGVKLTSKQGNRWEPWNPTVEVVLKKKRNPVLMYIKGTNWIEVPAQGIPVGYDLEIGDWVTPYGSGRTSDFVFKFSSNIKAFREYDLKMTLKFSNDLDGIQEYLFNSNEQSYYKWPYEAPKDGYQKELMKEIHKIPGKTEANINREAKYIFRVRTQIDASGNIFSARYGKISSEFELSPDDQKFLIRFKYFFNPDGTRNLEEDPENNLFEK